MILQSYAKVNLFLKITGRVQSERGTLHTLISRFMRVKELCDYLEIREGSSGGFEVVGDFDCALEDNTIYKAFLAVLPYLTHKQRQILKTLRVEVEKHIPQGGGLGGGSSNAATFLCFVRHFFALNLTDEDLAHIGAKIGSDVPFFIYDVDLANVSGYGQIVVPYEERCPKITVIDTHIFCNTKEVFKGYAKHFYNPLKKAEAISWQNMPMDFLRECDNKMANDLLQPALMLYPQLKDYSNKGYFFSGSGGSFWKFCD